MKILRKGDEFRKMPEKSLSEALVIKSMINQGWNYCSRQEYKEFFNKSKKEDSEVKETKDTKASKKKDSK